MIIQIPELSLVLLMGASGSGKSTFARRHFRATEILSSDFCRGLVSDDENNQAATADAFAVLHLIAEKRLAAGKLSVIDATNVQKDARKPFLELAKSQNVLPVVIVLDVPAEICHERNVSRSDRRFGPYVVRQQVAQLKKSLRHLEAEGFRYRHVLSSLEEVEGAELLVRQYAPVGAAAEVSLRAALELIARTARPELVSFGQALAARAAAVEDYRDTYRRFCWPVTGWQDLKIAPFQILATESRTYFDQTHRWHLEQAASWASHDSHGVIIPTNSRELNPGSLAECGAATDWWEELTRNGSEGMVVKPANSVTRFRSKLVQPGVKCRGRQYLRLIYGPTYLEQLAQLRSRNLGAKRSLALREFALGVEALERFVRREPLRRVHECVFGVLALESELVDPRL